MNMEVQMPFDSFTWLSFAMFSMVVFLGQLIFLIFLHSFSCIYVYIMYFKCRYMNVCMCVCKCAYLFMFELRSQRMVIEVLLCYSPPIPLNQCPWTRGSRSHQVPAIILFQLPLELDVPGVHKTAGLSPWVWTLLLMAEPYIWMLHPIFYNSYANLNFYQQYTRDPSYFLSLHHVLSCIFFFSNRCINRFELLWVVYEYRLLSTKKLLTEKQITFIMSPFPRDSDL